jgi:hypothetical protein
MWVEPSRSRCTYRGYAKRYHPGWGWHDRCFLFPDYSCISAPSHLAYVNQPKDLVVSERYHCTFILMELLQYRSIIYTGTLESPWDFSLHTQDNYKMYSIHSGHLLCYKCSSTTTLNCLQHYLNTPWPLTTMYRPSAVFVPLWWPLSCIHISSKNQAS